MGPLRLVAQDTWFSARRQGFDSPRGYESDECGFPSRALVLLPERGARFAFTVVSSARMTTPEMGQRIGQIPRPAGPWRTCRCTFSA